ncbi:uncharacterized protein [Antedon mediterranea]|uniref:uncharacterized protein n=1 Tax=Antedon mediterranea TaxID=105859 RepID=UPI003AF474B6
MGDLPAQNMALPKKVFLKLMLDLEIYLDKDEVDQLKYINRVHLPETVLANIEKFTDLVTALENRILVNESNFRELERMLNEINRPDLVDFLKNGNKIKHDNQRMALPKKVFLKMMLDIYHALENEDEANLKYLLRALLPKNVLAKIDNFRDFASALEDRRLIDESKLDELERLLTEINRSDLVDLVKKTKAEHSLFSRTINGAECIKLDDIDTAESASDIQLIPSDIQLIPSAITARGKDVKKAYSKALKEGSIEVNLATLKVVGQERVGKTCLTNALLGKPFENDHNVTDGIAVTRTVSKRWTDDNADSGNPSKQFARLVTDKLNAMDSLNKNVDKISAGEEQDGASNQTKQNAEKKSTAKHTETNPIDIEQQLDKDVMKKVEENKETFEETFNIWDHGGQMMYHGIHCMFMTRQALYIVVFDLSKPLDDHATVTDSNMEERKHHWSNLQFILSYIQTVYVHTRIVEKNMDRKVHKPTILIVGTHKGEEGI